jgi:hypothetical protein
MQTPADGKRRKWQCNGVHALKVVAVKPGPFLAAAKQCTERRNGGCRLPPPSFGHDKSSSKMKVLKSTAMGFVVLSMFPYWEKSQGLFLTALKDPLFSSGHAFSNPDYFPAAVTVLRSTV